MNATQQPAAASSENRAIFFCASLVGEIERKKSFSANFNDKALFCFVDSVDGRHWAEAEADAHVSEEMRQLRERERLKGKLWLNPAAVACALTHRDKLLSEAEKRDVVLCEDDVLLKPDFISLWSQEKVRRQFSECDGVVLMHYTSRDAITASGPPVVQLGEYQIFKLDEVPVLSGACYYAPPAVAGHIRLHQTPIRNSADHWATMRTAGVFSSIYAVHPTPCAIAGMASNIGYGGMRSNRWWAVMARRFKRMLQLRRHRLYEELVVRI